MSDGALEVFYNDDGTSYTSYFARHTKRAKASPVSDYALFKKVSSDGCTTKQDVDGRSQMLKSITRAYDEQRLKPPKVWVSW